MVENPLVRLMCEVQLKDRKSYGLDELKAVGYGKQCALLW